MRGSKPSCRPDCRPPENLRLSSLLRNGRVRIVLIAAVVLFLFPAVFHILPFPELEEFETREISSRIYDRNGRLIQVTPLKTGDRREYTPISKIPISIQKSL